MEIVSSPMAGLGLRTQGAPSSRTHALRLSPAVPMLGQAGRRKCEGRGQHPTEGTRWSWARPQIPRRHLRSGS